MSNLNQLIEDLDVITKNQYHLVNKKMLLRWHPDKIINNLYLNKHKDEKLTTNIDEIIKFLNSVNYSESKTADINDISRIRVIIPTFKDQLINRIEFIEEIKKEEKRKLEEATEKARKELEEARKAKEKAKIELEKAKEKARKAKIELEKDEIINGASTEKEKRILEKAYEHKDRKVKEATIEEIQRIIDISIEYANSIGIFNNTRKNTSSPSTNDYVDVGKYSSSSSTGKYYDAMVWPEPEDVGVTNEQTQQADSFLNEANQRLQEAQEAQEAQKAQEEINEIRREEEKRDEERRKKERRDTERRDTERRDTERREAERKDTERRDAERREAEKEKIIANKLKSSKEAAEKYAKEIDKIASDKINKMEKEINKMEKEIKIKKKEIEQRSRKSTNKPYRINKSIKRRPHSVNFIEKPKNKTQKALNRLINRKIVLKKLTSKYSKMDVDKVNKTAKIHRHTGLVQNDMTQPMDVDTSPSYIKPQKPHRERTYISEPMDIDYNRTI
jgi:hypothetical protein